MGSMNLIGCQKLAAAIIASGDLHKGDYNSRLEHKRKKEAEFIELTGAIFELIAPFGTAGLRDLAIYANELADEEEFRTAYKVEEKERRADELDLKVRAQAQAKAAAAESYQLVEDLVAARRAIDEAERARISSGAGLSDYDQMSLMNAVSSAGGNFAEFDFVRALVLRGVYTVPEIMNHSREQLKHLLS